MDKTVLGIFTDQGDIEEAIDTLKADGFNPKDISIVMKDTGQAKEVGKETGASVGEGFAKGATTGAVVGGITGFLAGTVAPALGGFLIGGPLGAALGLTGAAATTVSGVATGVVAGGLAGALMGFGLPKKEAQEYESRIRSGAMLLAVPANDAVEADRITDVFNEYNASDVRTVSQQDTKQEQPAREAGYAGAGYQYAGAGAKGGTTTHAHHTSKHHDKGKKGGLAGTYATGSYANPIQVEKYLKGMDYPCSKEQLIDAAKDHGADQNILHTLSDMPGDEFNSPKEISEAIGKIE